jgi:hypothetical protein
VLAKVVSKLIFNMSVTPVRENQKHREVASLAMAA